MLFSSAFFDSLLFLLDIEVKFDDNVGAISSSLAKALNLLSLSLSTVQYIQVNEVTNQQKDVNDYSNSEIDDEEEPINELELLESNIGNRLSQGMLLRNISITYNICTMYISNMTNLRLNLIKFFFLFSNQQNKCIPDSERNITWNYKWNI